LKIKKLNSNEWECETCKFINQIPNQKCKMCKNQNKSSILHSTTTSSANNKDGSLQRENSKTKEINTQGNQLNQKPIQQPNKCICYMIENDYLFINNICKICKRSKGEKPKQLPQQKPVIQVGNNDLRNSKEYQAAPQNNLSYLKNQQSIQPVKLTSKEINQQDKKQPIERYSNEPKQIKPSNIQINKQTNSNLKSTQFVFKGESNNSNEINPFKKNINLNNNPININIAINNNMNNNNINNNNQRVQYNIQDSYGKQQYALKNINLSRK